MKFDKEYSATHSMETAWYAADEDGNVALISYNDNGPVPLGLPDVYIGELLLGYEDDEECRYVNLTEDQVVELSGPLLPMDEGSDYEPYSFVKVEKNNREAFETAMKKANFYCDLISSECGIYEVDYDVMERSGLAKSLNKKKIISKVYEIPNIDLDDDFVNGKVVIKKNFISSPYYVYAEPYWTNFPLQRINIPKHPVKLDQLPEKLRQMIPNLPIKFKDAKSFQIAEWVPYKVYFEEWGFEYGCRYALLPLSDGTMAYLLNSIDKVDFLPYCSKKEKYNCKECPRFRPCPTANAQVFTLTPTVMFIVSPLRGRTFRKHSQTDVITMHSIRLPYLRKVPMPMDGDRVTIDDIMLKTTQHEVDGIFVECHKYLDDMVKRYRPRVIIIGMEVNEVMHEVYKMTNTEITIGDETYPFFNESEVETHRDEIERLAKLQYRGQVFPKVVSVEEMEKYGEIKEDLI